MLRHTLTLSLLLALLCACHKSSPATEAPTATPANEAAAPSQPGGDSSAPAPISGHGSTAADVQPVQPAAGTPASAIDFDLPKSWDKQSPSSSMRLAQAAIPGPGGPGDFAVFFFGPGGGGSVDANISRWVGQMETTDNPKPETFEAGGMKVTWVDVKGTLKPGQMGMSSPTAVSDARLYGAVVEGPGGPWFFKATGPDKTLAPQRDAFVTMLKSVRTKA